MKQKVALALGSGGARGLAHIGVIEELEKNGFEISAVSGSSIGAVIGGFYAMGKLREYADWLQTLKKRDVYSLMDVAFSTSGLLKGERVFTKLKTFIPDIMIEDMNIPFAAIATDIIHNKEVVFTEGSFYKAVRASVAIPAIIRPVEEEDSIFVDGGLLNPVPADRVQRTEGDLLVAVNLYDTSKSPYRKNYKNIQKEETPEDSIQKNSVPSSSSIDYLHSKIMELIPHGENQGQSYFSLLQLTTSTMLERISQLTLQINKPDILITIPANSAKTFDFHKASWLIEKGREAAKQHIGEYFQNRSAKYNLL